MCWEFAVNSGTTDSAYIIVGLTLLLQVLYAAEDYCITFIVFDSGQGHTPIGEISSHSFPNFS